MVAHRRPGGGRRGLHPERIRRGPRPAVPGAPRGDRAGRWRSLRLGARDRVDERLRECRDRTRAATPIRPRWPPSVAEAVHVPADLTLLLSTGVIGTLLPLAKVAAGVRTVIGDGLRSTDDALEAVAVALRTTDSRTKLATVEPGAARSRWDSGLGHRQRRSPRASG